MAINWNQLIKSASEEQKIIMFSLPKQTNVLTKKNVEGATFDFIITSSTIDHFQYIIIITWSAINVRFEKAILMPYVAIALVTFL